MWIESKFPKLTSGEEDSGRMIYGDGGERLGAICREIDWIDVGSVSASYKAKITGYRLEFWRNPDPKHSESDVTIVDQIFRTLAEATRAAKRVYGRY